jgi:hypothetical protein
VNNKLVQSTVRNAPQLPRGEITIALNGGRDTGVFLNREDLCLRGSSKTRFNTVTGVGKFYGWNGNESGDERVRATVRGCGPAVVAELTGATGSRPRLTITTTRHPDAPNMKELRVRLSRNLSLVRSRLDRSSATASAGARLRYVNRHTLRVTGLPSAGGEKVTIRLRRGAVRVSDRSRTLLRRGQSREFSVNAEPTPVSGQATATKSKFSVRVR